MFKKKEVREPSQWEVIATTRTVAPEDQATSILLKDQHGEIKAIRLDGYLETPLESLIEYMESVGQKSFALKHKESTYLVIKQEKPVDPLASIAGLPVKPPPDAHKSQ